MFSVDKGGKLYTYIVIFGNVTEPVSFYSVLGDYEVFSENNGNFLISPVWRVLLLNFFIMLVYMPLKYDKIFSCIHCLICLWQPLKLDVFL